MYTISKIKEKINRELGHRILYAILMTLIVIFSFILGKLSMMNTKNVDSQTSTESIEIYLPNGDLYAEKTKKELVNPLSAYILGTIDKTSNIPEPTAKERIAGEADKDTENILDGKTDIFASKTGKVYYVPNCKAGNRVKLENRIYFENEDHAQEEGFMKSKQCK